MARFRKYLFLLLFTGHFGFGQDFREKFYEALSQKDTVAQAGILADWEKTNADDAELFPAKYNYWFASSIEQTATELPGDSISMSYDELHLTVQRFDETKFGLALRAIDEGIARFPARLDFRFGKIYALGEKKDWQAFTDEILKAIDYSATIKNAWTWTNSRPLDEPRKFLISSIQGYFNQLYEADPKHLDFMQQISEKVLKHYPDDLMNLSNMAIIRTIKKDHNGALAYLLKAERLNPDDPATIGNIAAIYGETGQKKKAISYFKTLLKIGNEQDKAFARSHLEKLKKRR